MYILVNSSLKMGKGKIAGQVGHAVSSAVRYHEKNPTVDYKTWVSVLEAKIVLQATADEISNILKIPGGDISLLNRFVIHDAGKTQIPANSLTAVAFSPTSKIIQEFSNLKLL